MCLCMTVHVCVYVCTCTHKWVTEELLLSQEFPLWPGKESMTASWHWGPINDLRTLTAYLISQHTTALIYREREKDCVLSSFPHWTVIDPCLMECRCSDLVFTCEHWINALTVAVTVRTTPLHYWAEIKAGLFQHYWVWLLGKNIIHLKHITLDMCFLE